MKEKEYDVRYYSKKSGVKGGFDSIEELKEAEAKFDAECAEEEAKKQLRKQDYDAVEAAYKLAADKQKEANEAYATAIEAKNDFIRKYGSIHLTYKTPTTYTNIFDTLFDFPFHVGF